MSELAANETEGTRGLRVFLSYSRKDAQFVRQLADALTQRGYLADFDQSPHHQVTGDTGISASDDWWQRLQDMIAAADVMVLCVSPDSAASRVVEEEIAYARGLAKRVIAITCRELDFATAPPRLSALNVSSWFLTQPFDAALDKLAFELDRDVDWLRRQSSYTIQAKAWKDSQRQTDKLLFGAEIAEAEAWSARRPAKAQEIAELVLEFLAASRAERTRRERNQRNVRRGFVALIGIAFAITVAGAWFVINGQRTLARSQSLTLARAAQQLYDEGDHLRALRLSILASSETFLTPTVAEARAQLLANAQALQQQLSLVGHSTSIAAATFIGDGSRILSADYNGVVQLWDAATGDPAALPMQLGQHHVATLQAAHPIFMDAGSDGPAKLWNAETGSVIATLPEADSALGLFSGDGELLMTATGSELHLWRSRNGAQVLSIPIKGTLESARFLPDSGRIALWTEDGLVYVHDIATGAEAAAPLKIGSEVREVVSIGDGSRLLVRSDAGVQVWARATSQPDGPLLAEGRDVGGMIPSATSNALLIWSNHAGTGSVVWLDMATSQTLAGPFEHPNTIHGVGLSPDEETIAVWTWGEGGGVRIWSLAGADSARVIPLAMGATGVRFSEDSKTLLTWGPDGRASRWDVETGQAVGGVMRQDAGIQDIALSPDGARMLMWSERSELSVWSTTPGGRLSPSFAAEALTTDAELSPDESRLLTVDGRVVRLRDSNTGRQAWESAPNEHAPFARLVRGGAAVLSIAPPTAHVLDASSGAEITPPGLREHSFDKFALSRDRARLLTWNVEGNPGNEPPGAVHNWNLASGKDTIIGSSGAAAITSADFSEDATSIVTSAADGAVRVWDAAQGGTTAPAMQHGAKITGAVFSADGARIVSWSAEDGVVRVWDARSGKAIGGPIVVQTGVKKAYPSPDGSMVAAVSGNTVQLLNATTGEVVGPPVKHTGFVIEAMFGRRTPRLLTWATDDLSQAGEVRVWDAGTGRATISPIIHADSLRAVQFSADESRIMTATLGGQIRIWDVQTGQLLGPFLQQGRQAEGASWTADEKRLLSWGDGGASMWDVRWAMESRDARAAVADICKLKLAGPDSAVDSGLLPNGERDAARAGKGQDTILRAARRIDEGDAIAAPILRGRAGEDVCAWSPPWYDGLLWKLIGWAFS